MFVKHPQWVPFFRGLNLCLFSGNTALLGVTMLFVIQRATGRSRFYALLAIAFTLIYTVTIPFIVWFNDSKLSKINMILHGHSQPCTLTSVYTSALIGGEIALLTIAYQENPFGIIPGACFCLSIIMALFVSIELDSTDRAINPSHYDSRER